MSHRSPRTGRSSVRSRRRPSPVSPAWDTYYWRSRSCCCSCRCTKRCSPSEPPQRAETSRCRPTPR